MNPTTLEEFLDLLGAITMDEDTTMVFVNAAGEIRPVEITLVGDILQLQVL